MAYQYTSDQLFLEQEPLTKADLFEMIRRQSAQLRQFQETLRIMEARLTQLEQERWASQNTPAENTRGPIEAKGFLPNILAGQRREKEQAVRDALRHLNDPFYLAQCPLASLIAQHQGIWPAGQSVQELLHRGLETMKPVAGEPDEFQEQLHYSIIYLAYFERMKVTETARLVAVSERQYYRELNKAIQQLTAIVLEALA